MDFLLDDSKQSTMIKAIETLSNISLDNPSYCLKLLAYLAKCRVAPATGTETVAIRTKGRFIDLLQHDGDCFLDNFLTRRSNTQRAQFLFAGFGDPNSSRREKLILTNLQLIGCLQLSFHANAI